MNLNRTVQFVCVATGRPIPNLLWFREGETLNSSSRIRFNFLQLNSMTTQSVMTIENAVRSDDGNYSCVAEHRVGTVIAPFQLTVLCMFLKAFRHVSLLICVLF